jgi:hypothetical protein
VSDTTTLKKLAPGLAWLPATVRELPPTAIWSGIGAIVTTIYVISNAVHAQAEMDRRVTKDEVILAQVQTIPAELSRINEAVKRIDEESQHQREWREHLEQVAEEPPRRRR